MAASSAARHRDLATMSTRIVDDFAAVLLPFAKLNEDLVRLGLGDDAFYEDQYMLFELGGDNNFTTRSASNHEVRVRSWNLVAVGMRWEAMSTMVQFATSCEGGSMRFAGDRHTSPESYIRKARSTIAPAVPAIALSQAGMYCGAEIRVRLREQRWTPEWLHRRQKGQGEHSLQP